MSLIAYIFSEIIDSERRGHIKSPVSENSSAVKALVSLKNC